MKKALLLADPPKQQESGYIEHIFRDIYDGLLEIDTLYDMEEITRERLCIYQAVILYTGRLDACSRENVGNLIAYVADGGCLLALGETLNGCSYPEFQGLLGGRCAGESTPCLLDFVKAEAHGITQWAEDVSLTESPRFYELDPLGKSTVLFEMQYADRRYPAVWCRDYAWGRVFCLGFGNTPKAFLPTVRKVLWKAGLWFLDRL